MSHDLSRDEAARLRQERWEHHMHGLCVLDNHLNVEMEMASHRSSVLNHLVEQANRVKDLWLEFQRNSDDGCVLEDTAVQMAIEQHGLQSHNFHQPRSDAKTVRIPVRIVLAVRYTRLTTTLFSGRIGTLEQTARHRL